MSKKLIPFEQLLENDLEAICSDLGVEFARMAGRKLLITGGGGFLGYYLVQSALHWNRTRGGAQGNIDVTVFDNYARGVPQWLEELREDPSLRLFKHDMILPLPPKMDHYDYIIHAAGIASPIYYRAQPLKCIDANINGLRNLLDYSVAEREAGRPVEGLLFYSSSEIYGDPDPGTPTPETYRGNVSCTGPRACYDESKRFGETLCVTFASHAGVAVKVARPFNNYGPGLKITDGRVIPDFAGDVLAGRNIVMLSDGAPTRTFCYATDAITGYYKVLVRGRPGEAYNVGIDRPEISMAELAQRVIDNARELFDYQGRVEFGKSPEAAYLADNPNRRCPVIDKAREELGYRPSVLPDEGIYRSLVWYHYNRTAPAA